jgi:hypothetical protein
MAVRRQGARPAPSRVWAEEVGRPQAVAPFRLQLQERLLKLGISLHVALDYKRRDSNSTGALSLY